MTQKHVPIYTYILVMVFGVSTAWAEGEKQVRRELLPVPKACCEACAAAAPCCAAAGACPACAKTEKCSIACCLEKPCSIDFEDAPLMDVVEHFRECSGLNIVFDEPALVEAGVNLQRPLSIKLNAVPLKKALEMVLHQVHLSYRVDSNILVFTTEALARGRAILRVYPVDNLVPAAEPVVLGVSNREPIISWTAVTPSGKQYLEEAPEDTLVRLIIQNIEPDSWIDNGGLGTVDYFPPTKSLVVCQTAEVHEQIGDFLEMLNRGMQKDSSASASDSLQNWAPIAPATPTFGLADMPPQCPPLLTPTAAEAASNPLPPSCPLAALIGSPAPAMMQCLAVPPQPLRQTWQLRMVAEDGQARLIQDGSQDHLSFKSMEIKVPGGSSLKLTAVGNQIQAMHPALEARADAIARMGPAGCFLFEGHVKLLYHHQGQHAEVAVERALVNLTNGHVEIVPPADSARHGYIFGETIGSEGSGFLFGEVIGSVR